jgi:hypothetical protein
LRAHEREQTVRGNLADRFGVVEVVAEFRAFVLLALDDFRADLTVLPRPFAQAVDERGVFGDRFHEDLARAVERGFHVGDAFLRIDESRCAFFRRDRRIVAQRERERFEAGFARDLRLGAALGLVRQIEVFEARLGVGFEDALAQGVVELALFVDAGEDRGAAIFEFAQVAETFFEQAQLRVVEPAGDFLAVARDERHGRAAVEQFHGSFYLRRLRGDVLGDAVFDGEHAVLQVLLCVGRMTRKHERPR